MNSITVFGSMKAVDDMSVTNPQAMRSRIHSIFEESTASRLVNPKYLPSQGTKLPKFLDSMC
jgi:hypothetical protein